jgi:rhodanese-related sulfurtransferase
MPTSKTITVLAKYAKPDHHLLVINKADAPFLVDLRLPEAYLNRHVVGSRNVPFNQLLLQKEALKQQEKMILLAEPEGLPQAEEAYLVLTALGFKQVFVLPNGLAACRTAKLAFTTLTDARVQAVSSWFNGLSRQEKIPMVAGIILMIVALFSGKRRGLVLGVGTTIFGFGVRHQLKTEQASSIGEWLLKKLLKKLG